MDTREFWYPYPGSRTTRRSIRSRRWSEQPPATRLEIVPVNLESERVDEGDLLRRLRAGEQAAFDAIFRAHYAQLVGFAQGLLRDRAPAEDAAQEVMLELWRRRTEVTITESLRAYLLRATRNRALNQLRHVNVQKRAEPHIMGEDSVNATGASELTASELKSAIVEAIAELPPACREVFELSRGRGLRYAEIASTLGISVKTVESQMGKALKHLRTRLAPWLPEGRTL
jgi:RNA polymerase sigma-70 factor (ECF subfamily)